MRFFGIDEEYKGNCSYLDKREFGPVYWIKGKRKSSKYIVDGEIVLGPVYPEFPLVYSKYDLIIENNNNECRNRVIDQFQSINSDKMFKGNPIYIGILYKINVINNELQKNI